MNATLRQTSIWNEPVLGGSAYSHQEVKTISRKISSFAEGWIVVPISSLRGHFAPVAHDELLENRRPALAATHRRKRNLPSVMATGRTIVQAEIDDALDD